MADQHAENPLFGDLELAEKIRKRLGLGEEIFLTACKIQVAILRKLGEAVERGEPVSAKLMNDQFAAALKTEFGLSGTDLMAAMSAGNQITVALAGQLADSMLGGGIRESN